MDRFVEKHQGECPVVDEGQQLGLDDQGDLFGPISPRGPGRRKGSVAKSTKEWAKRIVESGASPLEFWARVILRDPAQLAAEWGIDLADVFDKKMAAAKELAPYIHNKMPIAINVGGGAASSAGDG